MFEKSVLETYLTYDADQAYEAHQAYDESRLAYLFSKIWLFPGLFIGCGLPVQRYAHARRGAGPAKAPYA